MGDMIGATAEAAPVPGIGDVEDERRVNFDSGLETIGWLPGTEADPGNIFRDYCHKPVRSR